MGCCVLVCRKVGMVWEFSLVSTHCRHLGACGEVLCHSDPEQPSTHPTPSHRRLLTLCWGKVVEIVLFYLKLVFKIINII